MAYKYKWYKDPDWQDIIIKFVIIIVISLIAFGVSFLVVRCTQNQMDGGVVIDKYMTEGHYQNYAHYDSTQKRSVVRTRWIPTSYTLVVKKTEDSGDVKVKEVPVSIEKFYEFEIGEIYEK